MIHTFYNYEEDNFVSVDDALVDGKKLNEMLDEAKKKVGKGILIIHEGQIQITKI